MIKKILWGLGVIAVLIAGSIGGQIGKEAGKTLMASSKPTQQEVEAKLIEGFKTAADQLKQKLPMMLDADTRLDNVSVGPGFRAVYYHSFPKYNSRDIDAIWLLTNFRPEVMGKVCANNEMKKSLQYGAIFGYVYSGNDGVEITRFEIKRDDCGLPKITL